MCVGTIEARVADTIPNPVRIIGALAIAPRCSAFGATITLVIVVDWAVELRVTDPITNLRGEHTARSATAIDLSLNAGALTTVIWAGGRQLP